MKLEEEGEKASLKLNFQKMKIMASGPNTLWKIDGEIVEKPKVWLDGHLLAK